ncbi:MAG: TPM domain-containing protein [Candidatus Paraimprobicoccus trichonymphae]|uniref:TPM domain-containing protein n=1 Tax=Candidatus Paraimprobicoccus trichonymphae TaxID=3033793 RepID=A0AA48KZS5_9FIRM|nr:MAG: TPM domain-containing protein [Candidatus Paraimprobicoccus trichonymphae]
MIKNLKFVFLFFVFFLSFFTLHAIVNYTSDFFINDYANVLDNDTKKYILSNSKLLDKRDFAQVVVLTLETFDQNSQNLEDFALDVFRDWKIGSKEKNHGLLLILISKSRKIRVQVGYGLEGILNDGKVGNFLEKYAVPHFKKGDFNLGIKNLYSVIISEIYSSNNLEVPDDVSESTKSGENSPLDVFFIVIIIVAVIAFGAIGGFFGGISGGGNYHNGRGGNFGGGGNHGGGGSSGGGGASRNF